MGGGGEEHEEIAEGTCPRCIPKAGGRDFFLQSLGIFLQSNFCAKRLPLRLIRFHATTHKSPNHTISNEKFTKNAKHEGLSKST